MSAGGGGLSSRQRNFRVAWRCLSQSPPVSPGSSGWLGGAGGDPARPCWDLLGSTLRHWRPFSSSAGEPWHGEPAAPRSLCPPWQPAAPTAVTATSTREDVFSVHLLWLNLLNV